MSFLCFPPNFFLQDTVKKTSRFGTRFSLVFSKKSNLLLLNFKKSTIETIKNHTLFLSDANELSFFKASTTKNKFNVLHYDKIQLHFDSNDRNITSEEAKNIFLDYYHKSEASLELKILIKDNVFADFENKELMCLWAEQQMKKKQNICDLIDMMDNDDYTNEALIYLGEKLIKLINKLPNKYQNLFNAYFKIGNCYLHENKYKKALKYYKIAGKFLKYIDVHHHFLYYFNLAKTKKSIGLQSNIEEQNLIYFYLSKETWEKKLYKNDMKEYFQFSA
jgi:tetratricopeptide (TPR) repeat protein